MSTFLTTRLAPFKSLNFTLFFLARTVSLVGRWSHELARSWIVLELTGASKALGLVMFAAAVPVSLLIFRGGSLVDRGDAKKIMVVTQFLMGLVVLALALLCEWGDIKLWHLIVFAVVEGIILSFDSPTFLAVVVRLVDKKDFQQAMAINSTNFHVGRMLGPVLAGLMLSKFGPASVFFFDSLGFFVVCLVVLFLKVKPPLRKIKNSGKGLSEWCYFYEDTQIRYQLGQLVLAMITIFPLFVTVLRTYAVEKFNLAAGDFGSLFMYPALGSVAGSLVFAIWKPKNPISAVKLGVPLVFVFYLLLQHLPTLALTAANMTVMGFSAYLMFAAITVGIQLDVKEEFRGRASSLIGFAFGCLGPVAAYPVGAFSDYFGEEMTFNLCATFFFLTSIFWYALHKKALQLKVKSL